MGWEGGGCGGGGRRKGNGRGEVADGICLVDETICLVDAGFKQGAGPRQRRYVQRGELPFSIERQVRRYFLPHPREESRRRVYVGKQPEEDGLRVGVLPPEETQLDLASFFGRPVVRDVGFYARKRDGTYV